MVALRWPVMLGAGRRRAAKRSKSAGQGAPRLSGRGRDGSCMTPGRVAGDLPDDARAAGLIVALSAALGCAEYIERAAATVSAPKSTGRRNDVS